jgi:hypothetical protein
VNYLRAAGKPTLDDLPRIEFQLYGKVVASLTPAGLLAAGNVFETDEAGLAAASGFVLAGSDNVRRAVLGEKGIYTLTLTENLITGAALVSWSTVTGAAGYNLHWGAHSGDYVYVRDCGTALSSTVTGLIIGRTYYFVVAPYDADGVEGAYSAEVSYTP